MIGSRKVGLAVITYNRQSFFEKVWNSVRNALGIVDELIVVNDGVPYDIKYENAKEIIQHETNLGVGASKNDALKKLCELDCDLLFLMEDDIIIKDPIILEKYVMLSDLSGVEHLNFGYHGPANRGGVSEGKPLPKLIINYGDQIKMALNQHCVGALSFYTRNIIDKVGFMDPAYINAWEHVDHTYMIIKARKHPQFWWFADVADSYLYINELACSENNSTIRGRTDWRPNIQNGLIHFQKKHGMSPGQLPVASEDEVITVLKAIKHYKDQNNGKA